jgi:hypothetical protein
MDDDDDIERSDASGNGDEVSDSGAPAAAERARPWWKRRWVAIVIIAVVGGASVLYLLDGHFGARGWCDATNRVRAKLGDAVTDLHTADEIFVAQVALAVEEAPALAARADRMIWPRGDLADRAAASLVAVTTAENPGDQQAPLLQFLELDNQFRDKHCSEPLRA